MGERPGGADRDPGAGGVALLFPGQASQAVGMGSALRAASPAARALFDLADRVTGLPITQLCEEGPIERLTDTEIAQPAVVTVSLAALAYLRDQLGERLRYAACAGHSVGELAACVGADALDEEGALRLVHKRAQAMMAACRQVDGTMAAVLGLDEAALAAACREASDATGSAEIANLNGPGQLVISGERQAVERAGALARRAGARRVVPLTVGGPFHSVYMRPAAEALRHAIQATTLRDAHTPLVLNVTGRQTTGEAEIREELQVQVYSPVRWADSLSRMAEMGCDRFLELGPGAVLTGLTRRALPNARATSFGEPATLEAAAGLLAD